MKVTIEVECTPEEARRAMGLPDLSPIHERYLAQLQQAMENGGVSPEMLKTMMTNWAPMSEAGTDFWRTMFSAAAKPGS